MKNFQLEIKLLNARLRNTEHFVTDHIEGIITDEEYAIIKAKRQAWRDEIAALKAEKPIIKQFS